MKNENLEIHHLTSKKNRKKLKKPKANNLRFMSKSQHKKQFGKKGRR